MSENPFTTVAEEAAPVVVEEETGSRRNVVLLGALAAVAVGAGAFLLLGGGEDDLDEFAVPVTRAPVAPAASAAPVAKLPVAVNVPLGRNPFRALYVQPAAGGGAPTGSTTTPTTTGSVPTAPLVLFPGPATGGGAPQQPAPQQPAPQQPAPAQPAPQQPAAQSTVALKGVVAGKDGAAPTGSFVYDGQEVTGAPGDVMAGKLLVISLQQDATGGWFANLQLGDGSPFEVHENQTVVVQ